MAQCDKTVVGQVCTYPPPLPYSFSRIVRQDGLGMRHMSVKTVPDFVLTVAGGEEMAMK